MPIQLLPDRRSWFLNNQDKTPIRFRKYLKKNLISDHHKIKDNYDLTIIISYYKIIPKKFLLRSKHNLVIHESNLPKGRGMSPLYWQILKGETKVIFTLFECSQKMDEGRYYFKRSFHFRPTLLFEEIKKKQLKYAFDMVDIFLKKYKKKKNLKSYPQKNKPTYFPKILPTLSEIIIDKSIKSQINKIRTRDNENYPAYFFYKKRKYIIKIF